MKKKTIILVNVSRPVKAVLDRVKEKEGHKSYDSLIRTLLLKAGYEI